MRLWKAVLNIKYKDKVKILSASCNDAKSNTDIEQMGINLASEVENWIDQDRPENFRLSFIGHSLGGIVIRTALSHLEKLSQFMHTYISLASPHCGYASSKSMLVDTGLLVITKWNKCLTLE